MLPRRPLLLGHRGARATRSIPENTLASFDLCLEHGCDGFEFDVRRTADGEAVVCHDATIAGVRLAEARSADLADLQAKGLVPTLETVLQRYAGRCFLDIELKDPGLEAKVADLLQRWPPQHGYVVSSFLPETIVAMKTLGDISLGLIADNARDLKRWSELPVSHVIPNRQLVTEQLVTDLHASGRKVFAWTVNDTEEMRKLVALEVEGLISDETEKYRYLR